MNHHHPKQPQRSSKLSLKLNRFYMNRDGAPLQDGKPSCIASRPVGGSKNLESRAKQFFMKKNKQADVYQSLELKELSNYFSVSKENANPAKMNSGRIRDYLHSRKDQQPLLKHKYLNNTAAHRSSSTYNSLSRSDSRPGATPTQSKKYIPVKTPTSALTGQYNSSQYRSDNKQGAYTAANNLAVKASNKENNQTKYNTGQRKVYQPYKPTMQRRVLGEIDSQKAKQYNSKHVMQNAKKSTPNTPMTTSTQSINVNKPIYSTKTPTTIPNKNSNVTNINKNNVSTSSLNHIRKNHSRHPSDTNSSIRKSVPVQANYRLDSSIEGTGIKPANGGFSPVRATKRRQRVEVRESCDKDLVTMKNSIQIDPTRKSSQQSGIVMAYAVNTNEGLVRDYNEDRVSIILNIMQSGKEESRNWPKASFFGVYDGHCGSSCAEFLRDNLHKYILRDKNFPKDPKAAIENGFAKAENEFLKRCLDSKGNLIDKSGSCAVIALVVEDKCYLGNVGDSRAILSSGGGKRAIDLTEDHKPSEPKEKERILGAGGKIYRTQIQTISLEEERGEEVEQEEIVNGPYRVFPGRLSVSRTIGDFEAKLTKLGGNPDVIVPTPQVYCTEITDEHDFLILGCDGVFDRLSTEDLISKTWEKAHELEVAGSRHDISAKLVDEMLRETFQRKAWDNITIVMVSFKNLFRNLQYSNKRSSVQPVSKSQNAPRLQNYLKNESQSNKRVYQVQLEIELNNQPTQQSN